MSSLRACRAGKAIQPVAVIASGSPAAGEPRGDPASSQNSGLAHSEKTKNRERLSRSLGDFLRASLGSCDYGMGILFSHRTCASVSSHPGAFEFRA